MRSLLKLLVLAVITMAHPVKGWADPYVRCVQNQLTDLSIDVGEIDGQFGPKTRDGVTEVQNRIGFFPSMPEASKENASVWCARLSIPLKNRTHWPSWIEPEQLITDDTVSDAKRQLLERNVRNARLSLLIRLNVEVPGTLTVVAASTMTNLVDLLYVALGGIDTKINLRRSMTAQCRNRNGLSGASFGGAVALCPNKAYATQESLSPKDSRALKRMITHELAHEFQTQMVGNYRKMGGVVQVQKRGPKWLVEGAAIALELDIVVKGLSAPQQVGWFEKQQSYSGAQLKRLSRQDTKVDYNFQLYAGYAGVLLASRHSHSAFATFWDATPESGWERAFEIAFGQSVDEFYASIDTK